MRSYLTSKPHLLLLLGPNTIAQSLILNNYIKLNTIHTESKEMSLYLFWRSIPLFTFSNPSKIPERSKLTQSTGSTNFTKCKRTSKLSDEKCVADMFLA